MRRGIQLVAVMLLGVVAFAAEPARPSSPDCPNTSWDLSQEVALNKGAATPIQAGAATAGAPKLELSKLYQVTLTPVERVTLLAAPKPSQGHDANAGLLTVEVPASGSYRVSLDSPVWVDMIGTEGAIASTGFQGHQVCSLIHKVVVFPLPPGRVTLQISGGSSTVKLVVTRSRDTGGHGAAQ